MIGNLFPIEVASTPHEPITGPFDYVNALVLNESGEALILLADNPHTGRQGWRLVEGVLAPGEDPYTAVQQLLHHQTGYEARDWTYLSSYLTAADSPDGVGHFFCAQKVRPANQLPLPTSPLMRQWVPIKELRYALLDGRITSIHHAVAVSLAFLTVLK